MKSSRLHHCKQLQLTEKIMLILKRVATGQIECVV
jgi:hypothetical protein